MAAAGDNLIQKNKPLTAAMQVAFKIAHHSKIVEQKLMMFLLMK